MSQQENLDESVNLREGSINTSARAIINDKTKSHLQSILLALSIVALVAMTYKWRDAAIEDRLTQNSLSDLSTKVQVQDREILALQVGQACKKEH